MIERFGKFYLHFIPASISLECFYFPFFFTDIESYRPRSYEDFQGPNLNLQIIFVCIFFNKKRVI